ncbi:MAG: hypothetical protein L3J45_08975 [Flavobacteriaceae bacterium]|nr:hypothetical protein [Flavobacteriaceae bacterium]
MRNSFIILILLVFFTSCNNQKVHGVWMSYDDRLDSYSNPILRGVDGFVIDFDKSVATNAESDTLVKLNINFEKMTIEKVADTSKRKFNITKKTLNKIVIGDDTLTVFHRLNLNHKLELNYNQIIDYLIKKDFQNTMDSLELNFSDKFYRFDKQKRIRVLENIWKETVRHTNSSGYWYIKEINKNFFLFFTLEETLLRNVYQITAIDKEGVKLTPLQEVYPFIHGIDKLKIR